MTPGHYVIIALSVVVLILLIANVKRKSSYGQKLKQLQGELDSYKLEIVKNFKDTVPYGERLLFKTLSRLFEEPAFSDFTIYHHLEFAQDGRFWQIDFFIVSPKGLFVLESKMWKGITYIYTKSYPDIFSQTAYDSFGVGSNEKIRIFNAQANENNNKKITLSSYDRNPVAQARSYSKCLMKKLNISQIKNAVVFCSFPGYDVLHNDKPVNCVEVDQFTQILTDSADNVKQYFEKMPNGVVDPQRFNGLINAKGSPFAFRFKMDKSNYKEAPFCQLDESL